MKFRLKRLAAVVMASVLAFSVCPTMTAQAKGEVWTHPGDGWHYLEGTDVKVNIKDGVLRISGTGAIPDYDYWSLQERPWNSSDIQYVFIDDTISSIGSYAFFNMKNLKYIHMGTNTFISDISCFDRIAYIPVFRIYSKGETTKMIGNIPYTSLDSIKAVAQTNLNGACYILDSKNEADKFQNSTNPTITNVYYATDSKAPWQAVQDNGNGGVATPICSLSSKNPNSSYVVSAQRRYPGQLCYEAFAAFLGDYTFATTFNLVVTKNGKNVDYTDNALEYVLTIPKEFRMTGRTFKLLAIGSGTVYTYDDLDSSDSTITFATQRPITAYALIYK